MLTVTGLYMWDTGEGRWNFASMATMPFVAVEATPSLDRADHRTAQRQGRLGLFDAFFAPIIASYHFDQRGT